MSQVDVSPRRHHSALSRSPSVRNLALELLTYAALAVGAVSAAAFRAGQIIGDGVDMFGTFWFYWFIEDSLVKGRDPSTTDLFFHPLGKDIFAHTGNNFLDAVVSIPLQWMLGFPDYQPWFVALMLFGNAVAMRPLARHVVGPGWAAWAATVLWMLNPYVLFECMTGRFTQAFLWFLPLAILGLLRAGEPGRKGVAMAVLAGVATGLQAWTYWFMGYFIALAFGWLVAVGLIQEKGGRLRLLGRYLLGGLACVLTVSPAMVAMARLEAAGTVPGLESADPGSIFEGPGQLANNVAAHLHGYVLMEQSGQPMLMLAVWGTGLVAMLLLGRDRLRWVGVLVLSLAFAVGPVWPQEQGPGLVMVHYMAAYRYLPFFERLWFPYRLLVITFLALSLGLGTALARAEGLRKRWLPWLPAAVLPVLLVGANLAEQNQHLAYPLLHRDLTPPRVYELIGEAGGSLIELPIGMARISIAFQPVHEQPVFGGMAENARLFWPEGFDKRLNNSFIRFLREATRDPGARREYEEADRASLEAEGFRWVVLDRHMVDSSWHHSPTWRRRSQAERDQASFIAQDFLREVLGEPDAVDGTLVVWDLEGAVQVPPELRPTETNLSTRTWPQEDMPEYEEHLRELGRAEGPDPRR